MAAEPKAAASPSSFVAAADAPYLPGEGRVRFTQEQDALLWPNITLALLVLFLLSGISGLFRRQVDLANIRKEHEPQVKVEQLQVDLTDTPPPPMPDEPPPPPDPNAPPPPPDAVVVANVPAPVAVASPNAVVAFAMPVEGATRIVQKESAASATPVRPVPRQPPTPQKYAPTYGTGHGQQARPPYPFEARKNRWQGEVAMRMHVGADGRVKKVEVTSPSRYKILNESAVATVRDLWRFPVGEERIYDFICEFRMEN